MRCNPYDLKCVECEKHISEINKLLHKHAESLEKIDHADEKCLRAAETKCKNLCEEYIQMTRPAVNLCLEKHAKPTITQEQADRLVKLKEELEEAFSELGEEA